MYEKLKLLICNLSDYRVNMSEKYPMKEYKTLFDKPFKDCKIENLLPEESMDINNMNILHVDLSDKIEVFEIVTECVELYLSTSSFRNTYPFEYKTDYVHVHMKVFYTSNEHNCETRRFNVFDLFLLDNHNILQMMSQIDATLLYNCIVHALINEDPINKRAQELKHLWYYVIDHQLDFGDIDEDYDIFITDEECSDQDY